MIVGNLIYGTWYGVLILLGVAVGRFVYIRIRDRHDHRGSAPPPHS
jgi:prolipoprotein diacylglyceryltransferase